MNHFMADPHFGWGLTTRGFATAEEHDECVLDEINKVVEWNHRLFILGDFAKRAAQSYLVRIRCQNVHLILGNHDKDSYCKLFKTVDKTAEIKLGDHYVWLSHYPHCYWPRSHRGSLHLYGHLHDRREATMDAAFPGRRSQDCSLDTAMRMLGALRPFNEHEILDNLLAKPGHDPIEFYKAENELRNSNYRKANQDSEGPQVRGVRHDDPEEDDLHDGEGFVAGRTRNDVVVPAVSCDPSGSVAISG